MADLLPISERLYDLSILLVFRFDDTYEHDVLLNHHIPVEEVRQGSPLGLVCTSCSENRPAQMKSIKHIASTFDVLSPSLNPGHSITRNEDVFRLLELVCGNEITPNGMPYRFR